MEKQSSQVLLSAENISFTAADKQILDQVSFCLNKGEILTIVGPNGAGKSTLLTVVLGLKKPSRGKIVTCHSLRIGYVPQFVNRDEAIPVSVDDFIQLSKKRMSQTATNGLLEELDLLALKKQLLCELSGGELRRVLLARALLNQPDLLVLDEPTAGVDAAGQAAFYQRLKAWRDRQHFAILMVSHDLHLVMAATDKVICLNQHICCQGKPIDVIHDARYQALFTETQDRDLEITFYPHQPHDKG